MSRWSEGTVVSQKQWNDTLFSLYVTASVEPYLAGQFTQIGLPVDSKILFRPYSFANPSHDAILEFYYTRVGNGQLTPLLSQLKAGDKIYVSHKAAGRFTIESIAPTDALWMCATGTGLGVFLSLLRTPLLWERFHQVILIHSVRLTQDLTHQTVIEALKQAFPSRFQFVKVVTREKMAGAFSERIPELLSSGQLEAEVGVSIHPSQSHVMLCGNPVMVKEVTSHLEQRGLHLHHGDTPGQITIESYWKER